MSYSAIILAGGKSSRMGTDKGLVKLIDEPMVAYIIKALQKTAISDILIISNNPEYEKFGYPVFADVIKEKGPLGGIYTGLLKSPSSKNLILSCDIPFINEQVINLLIDRETSSPILVVKHGNQLHHLIGVYDASLTKSLGEHLLNNKLKVELFIKDNSFEILDLSMEKEKVEERVVVNINTMEELKNSEYEMRR